MPSAPADVITVLLVEDNLLTRAGVTSVLSDRPEFVVVGQAVDGNQGVTLYRSFKPQVVITDLRMPELDGVALVQLLMKETPPARIVVLTNYDGEENIFRAIRAGALGYVTKDAGAETLFEAIRTVARGERYLPAEIGTKFAARSVGKGMSPREQQVLENLQKGLANKEIAQRLGLSDKTIALYVAAVLGKLGAHTRTEAVTIAIERGFLLARR